MSPSSGRTSTSPAPSVARLRSVFSVISAVIIWSRMTAGLVRSFSPSSFEPTSTTIIRDTPIARISSIGTFSAMPPSTSNWSPTLTGANAPGTDMLARIARARSPSSKTTFLPVTMSAETARNGIGSASKSSERQVDRVRRRNSSMSFCPRTKPTGKPRRPSL